MQVHPDAVSKGALAILFREQARTQTAQAADETTKKKLTIISNFNIKILETVSQSTAWGRSARPPPLPSAMDILNAY
jgi:hypothetical protein